MPDICNNCTQEKQIIDINYNMTSLADFVYDLVYLDLFILITLVDYNSTKYVAFLTDDLSRY